MVAAILSQELGWSRSTERDALDEYVTLIRNFREKIGLLRYSGGENCDMSLTERYLGAIDQGTTSTRFMVFDRSGRCVSIAQREHQQFYPQPGWVEHDPQEILERTLQVISDALNQADLKSTDLAAVGIANQRETTVLWDRRTGDPVMNAIVWQDTRVNDEVSTLIASSGVDQFRASTGTSRFHLFQWAEDPLDIGSCSGCEKARARLARYCSAT